METGVAYVSDIPKRHPNYILHPKPLGSLSLFIVYLILLYRSSSKSQPLETETTTILSFFTSTHKALLHYVTLKCFRLLAILLILLKRFFGNVLQGPAAIAAEFLSKQGLALQDTVQGKLLDFLNTNIDLLGEKTKETVGDPYMPQAIRQVVDEVVNSLLPDAKRLIFSKTDELIRNRSPMTRHLSRAIILDDYEGRVRAKRRKESEKSESEQLSLYAYQTLIHSRDYVYDTLASPYRWWYQTKEDIKTNAILDEIANETVAEEDVEEEEDITNELSALIDEDGEEYSSSRCQRIRVYILLFRAKILYVSSPCDKSIWQCLRDYRWLSLTALGLAPYGVGTIWWLFMFFLHEKRDEYQVSNFIVGFMVSKFLGGCGLLIFGAFKYYLCATRDLSTCDEDGPRVIEYYDGILFFAQTLLVWLCYFILPMTHPCRTVKDERDAYLVEDMEKVHLKLGPKRPKGGRLVDLFWWDSFCVFLVLVLGFIAWSLVGQTGWQLRATLFWLKALFGLLSLPFLIFKIPVLNTLLMQVRATGYDEYGRVVLHCRVRPPENNAVGNTLTTTTEFFLTGGEVKPRMERQSSLGEEDHVLASLSDDDEDDDDDEKLIEDKIHVK